jgi:hypothetical protein
MAVLASCLQEARAGRAGVVLLAGEPGIGKTRLLEEFPPPALAPGVTLLRGGSSRAEGNPFFEEELLLVAALVAIRLSAPRPL